MKKVLPFFVVMCLSIPAFSQFTTSLKKHAKDIAPAPVVSLTGFEDLVAGQKTPSNIVSKTNVTDDPVVSVTRYDMQSNGAVNGRCYVFPDGTIGTATIWSHQDASWTDRGTGYNYFDGSSWGSLPAQRVETVRTGSPSYCPFGPSGELIIAHGVSGPLVMNTRTVKGTGAWTQTIIPALPSGMAGMLWPRVVTNGPDHSYIHIIALTMPTANGGQIYNGMNGALVYSRSLDGGLTWSDWIQPADLNSSHYTGFGADTYVWAEPKGNTLAFTIGNGFYDQMLLKSRDNGTTWTKTVIHHSPYNLGGSSPAFFNASDGKCAIALDNMRMAHVVFGLTSDSGSNSYWYYNMFAQGIVYWNEYQPELREDLNPDSLFATGNLAGWVKDTNVLHLDPMQFPYWGTTSLTSFPALVIDDHCKISLIFAGATALFDPNNFYMRHIFGREGCITGGAGEIYWHEDTLVDITGDWIQYNFAECMYPSASPEPDGDYVDILFQKDDYGGSYVLDMSTGEGQQVPDDNSMTLIKWSPFWWWGDCSSSCVAGVSETPQHPVLSVEQNVPNPFSGLTEIKVYHQFSGDISVKIVNVMGQTLMTQKKTDVVPGVSQFVIDGSQLAPGVYFYTVSQGNQAVTKKMVVE
jgi:hypothetical protein